ESSSPWEPATPRILSASATYPRSARLGAALSRSSALRGLSCSRSKAGIGGLRTGGWNRYPPRITPTPGTATVAAPAISGNAPTSAPPVAGAITSASNAAKRDNRRRKQLLLVVDFQCFQDARHQVVAADGCSELDHLAWPEPASYVFEHRIRDTHFACHGFGVGEDRPITRIKRARIAPVRQRIELGLREPRVERDRGVMAV